MCFQRVDLKMIRQCLINKHKDLKLNGKPVKGCQNRSNMIPVSRTSLAAVFWTICNRDNEATIKRVAIIESNWDVINACNSKSLLERRFLNFAIDLKWKKLPLITALICLSEIMKSQPRWLGVDYL